MASPTGQPTAWKTGSLSPEARYHQLVQDLGNGIPVCSGTRCSPKINMPGPPSRATSMRTEVDSAV